MCSVFPPLVFLGILTVSLPFGSEEPLLNCMYPKELHFFIALISSCLQLCRAVMETVPPSVQPSRTTHVSHPFYVLPSSSSSFRLHSRSGMLNISPIGRNCSREERNEYEIFDLANNIRKNMVEAMKKEFADLDMTYSIGGQISFDCFPTGWDKTYCLKFLDAADFDEIHFFGDKTFEGGNDFEIFSHERTIGHTVTSPEDTKAQCTELFMS
jgi:Eukaryotic phosphomannomutase